MIPHNRPTFGPEEARAAQRVLDSGWVAQGSEVEAFEDELCSLLGLPTGHAVAVSSGTSALFLALWALEAKGSGVACPVYACSALTNAIDLAGATPILIDTERDGPNIDMAALAKSKVRIAIVPHIFGLPVDLFERNGMDVIEDCAQALGASVGGKPVGLRGAVGIFSFYATKIITSGGQGGMLVSNERAIIDAVRDYRKFDCRNGRKPRFNFQMTDLQAAIGREQLRKLPSFVNRRREIFEQYRNAGIHLVDTHSEASPVRYRSVIRSKNPQWMINELAGCAIKTIIPVEEWELLGPVDKFPSAAEFARTTVSLPTYPSLSNEDLKYIIKSLHEIEDESLSWPVYEN